MVGATTSKATRRSKRPRGRNAPDEDATQATVENSPVQSCDCCLLPIKHNQSGNQGIARIETCIHRFHFACIKKWSELETTCPQCKAVFTTIERFCPKTNKMIEAVKCSSLFLWDHPDGEAGHDHSPPELQEETTQAPEGVSQSSQGDALKLLSPDQLETLHASKKQKKVVEVKEAVVRTERHLKHMALNDVCYAPPPTVTYEAKPLPIEIKRNTEFKLKPVYQEDFIAKL